MKRYIICALLGAFLGASSFALELGLRPAGFAFFPSGGGADYYETGGGARLGLEADISTIISNPLGLGYTLGIEAGWQDVPLARGADETLQLYPLGGVLGLVYYPFSRLFLRAEGVFGIYEGLTGRHSSTFWWTRFGGEAGFRVSPSFLVAAGAGYQAYQNKSGGSLLSGFYLGLALRFGFSLPAGSSGSGGLELEVIQEDAVYPLLASLYRFAPAARIRLVNRENAEIRNVRLSFRAGKYTSSEFPCGQAGFIARGRAEEFPLYADFSPEILGFTEKGRVAGEIVIRYEILGEERETLRDASVSISNRNLFPAGDPAALAAFVSPLAPEVLEYAKYMAGMARSMGKPGINANMQTGVYLFEGLAAAGIAPLQRASVQEAQYPAQTLAYRSGGLADLGLLYAASLEAAGVKAGLLPLEGDFIVALSLGISGEAAHRLFLDPNSFLVYGEEAFLPLSLAALNSGFTESRREAAKKIAAAFEAGGDIEFVLLEEAWRLYPPAPLPPSGARGIRPAEKAVTARADNAFSQYLSGDILPLISDALSRGSGHSPQEMNRLANLYVCAGKMAEAKTLYERTAALGSVAGMTNRGNLALLENDFAVAERWFTQALKLQPENPAALRGLSRISAQR
jgi:tetratricopeptide (TPR) repeat protein